MAEGKPKRKWTPKRDFKPGGEKGKLHREMGIPQGQKIPQDKLAAAAHSSDPEKRRDAIRAQTMEGWHKGGSRAHRLYGRKPTVRRD